VRACILSVTSLQPRPKADSSLYYHRGAAVAALRIERVLLQHIILCSYLYSIRYCVIVWWAEFASCESFERTTIIL